MISLGDMTAEEIIYKLKNLKPSHWYTLPVAEAKEIIAFVKDCIDSDSLPYELTFNEDYTKIIKYI